MQSRITYWKEADGRYLGYLNKYPDEWTQGDDLDELKEQLRDLSQAFGKEAIAGIKKGEELDIASNALSGLGLGAVKMRTPPPGKPPRRP